MIPYAGQDRKEKYWSAMRRSRALMMFQVWKKDTAFIAGQLNVSEPRIHRWITEERSRDDGLPNPYENPQ